MAFTMVVEQTKEYRNRMCYDPQTKTFFATEYDSLTYRRSFLQPYGWIKESGTPPEPHWDVILMTDSDYPVGAEVEINVVGVFKRNDGDHKYIAVEKSREIDDFVLLAETEKADLNRLYPYADEGEGWFGKEEAEKAIKECGKAM